MRYINLRLLYFTLKHSGGGSSSLFQFLLVVIIALVITISMFSGLAAFSNDDFIHFSYRVAKKSKTGFRLFTSFKRLNQFA